MSNPEVPFRPEQPEIDWSPHSLDDDCPWNEFKEYKDFRLPWRKARIESRELLQSFIETEGSAQKILSTGEKFELSLHNVGTIIRFERDQLFTVTESESSNIFWGIVNEVKDKKGDFIRYLMFFQDWRSTNVLSPLASFTADDILIGEIEHDRLKRSGIFGGQMLTRTNWVEVWQFGQGVRETEKEKGTIGRLVPKPTTQ